jgi:dihydroorotate dehydrogenase electron transfer subunit
MVDLPRMYRVVKLEHEAERTKVLWLRGHAESEPGQFFMVWIPGVDEKPYATSHVTKDGVAITVQVRGKFSTRLVQVREGEMIGLRGPYGKPFRPHGRMAIVAGGMGVAAVGLLHEERPQAPFLCGAKTASEVIFAKRFPEMRVFTDDGSAGEKGFPTDALPDVIRSKRIELVCACGPEVMIKRVFDICEEHGIECQASLERYMKCGFGVCGQCACGQMLVCKDGPVFGSALLRQMPDFGKSALLKNGKRVAVHDYFRKT